MRRFVMVVMTLGLAFPATSAAEAGIVVKDGASQPVFSYEEAIRETLWVEAPMDSDFDGRNDRIRLDVIRPAETEDGLKVPTIMEASPYYNPGDNVTTPRGFPGWWDEYFVPRGYAIVQVEMQGTSRSEGCPAIGGIEDSIGTKAAVEWLLGRAPGQRLDGTPVEASWSSGDVGMQGLSYNGSLPIAVAVEGVPGLRTVVPISPVSVYYRYSRDQGIRRAQWGMRYPAFLANLVMRYNPRARELCADYVGSWGAQLGDDTGDFTPWWQERNYVPKAGAIKAAGTAVFMVHGYGDTNVKPQQTADLWYEVARRNVARKIWIHRGGHSNPTSFRIEEWQRVMHLWMDHWLYGIDNGIMDRPMADIQRPDGHWETDASWPPHAAKDVDLRLGAGALSLHRSGGGKTQTFVDNWLQNVENGIVADPTETQPSRLAYITPPLRRSVRISGTPRMSVRFSADAASASLSALLVDYGAGETISVEHKTPVELTTEPCSRKDVAARTGCAEPMDVTSSITPERVITRGSIDGKNHVDLRWSSPLQPGRAYNIRWELQPHDYVVPAGHRIGLILIGNYRATIGENNVVRDTVPEGREITVHLGDSRLTLPIVGGRHVLGG